MHKLYIVRIKKGYGHHAHLAAKAISLFDPKAQIGYLTSPGVTIRSPMAEVVEDDNLGTILPAIDRLSRRGAEASIIVYLDALTLINAPVKRPQASAVFAGELTRISTSLFVMRASALRKLLPEVNAGDPIDKLALACRDSGIKLAMKDWESGFINGFHFAEQANFDWSRFRTHTRAVWFGMPTASDQRPNMERCHAMKRMLDFFQGKAADKVGLPLRPGSTDRPQTWRSYPKFDHRTGWISIVDALDKKFGGKKPPGFEDFIEAAFVWKPAEALRYTTGEPWAGIAHNPRGDHPVVAALNLQPWNWIRGAAFRAARRSLQNLIVLSDHHANQLRANGFAKPITVILHPTTLDHEQWSEEEWITGGRRLLSVGQWLRNTEILHQLDYPDGFSPEILRKGGDNFTTHNQRYLGQCKNPEVKETSRLAGEDYDRRLASSVMVTEVYDASANNAVIESIARATPHLINRHPGPAQYLGEDYPLFWDRKEQIIPMAQDRVRIKEAHDYLSERRLSPWLSLDHFAGSVSEVVKSCLP
ncbi:MAG: hypothetical protein AAF191_05030 [Verrucomicrobiota bacterium]